MKRIDQLISQKTGIAKTATVAYLCQKAEKMIQEQFNDQGIKVKKYQNQILFLKIPNPSLAQQIYSQQTELIKKLNQDLETSIKRLSYRL